jgi:hypothetical protein
VSRFAAIPTGAADLTGCSVTISHADAATLLLKLSFQIVDNVGQLPMLIFQVFELCCIVFF